VEVQEIQEQGYSIFGWSTWEYSQTLPHILEPGEDLTFWVEIWPGVFDNYYFLYDSVQIITSVEEYYMTLAVNPDLLGSVNDPDETKVNIYPSPFSHQLTIDLSNFNQDIETITITDLSGKTVKEFAQSELGSNVINWNVKDAAMPVKEGIYLIQISTEESTQVFKVIKMR
jgi:hypothetical protein